MLGKFWFPWRLVTDSVRSYIETGLLHVNKLPNMTVTKSFQKSERVVLSLLTVRNDSQCQSLIKLLISFRQSRSSDPRDRVYALLGLANDQGAHDMVSVDYSKSVEAVYLECAQCLVRDGMEMLIQAGTPHNRKGAYLKPSLPSWVPGWSREMSNYFRQRQDLYRAAGETQSDIEVEDHGNGLNVRGIRIDVVRYSRPCLDHGRRQGGLSTQRIICLGATGERSGSTKLFLLRRTSR